MAHQPISTKCPECGAKLKPGTDICWLCAYKSPVIVSSNQTRSPTAHRQVTIAIAMLVVALLMVPSTAAAFFVCCAAAYDAETRFDPAIMGAIGGGVVFTLFMLLLVHLSRKR